ncbi:MAG TPA: hemerythrin domain-containing protein [Pseudonocardiaceae bacterium]|nr:hemerythrin domain-containing protein [Pseudonocardiaceae bacterium]
MDITQLILDDHQEQRRLFAILEQIDPANTAALGAVWERLAAFLEVHAEAEEQLFYPELLRVGEGVGSVDPQDETKDAIGDHNDIRNAVAAVADHEVGSQGWYAAVAKANEANSDHMAEEEREGLTDFRRNATLQLRYDLAVVFAQFEATHFSGVKPVDKDPERYVRDVEEEIAESENPGDNSATQTAAKTDGSLGIGSLHKQ